MTAALDYPSRIDAARSALAGGEFDALLVTNLTNVRYLCGFSGSNGQVLLHPEGAVFLTDPRYGARAADIVVGCEIVVYRSRLTAVLPQRLAAVEAKRVGIEGLSVTVAQRDDFAGKLEDFELVATTGVIEKLRRAKDATEIELISSAVAIGDAAFEWVLQRLRPGVTEREIALDLEVWMRSNGAEHISFDPIVGSGPLSAHIHHTPSERALAPGDFVLMDFGCRVDGYCSDLTRTVVLGSAGAEQRELYETVLAAQKAAIDAVRAGVGGADADRAARAIIDDAGHSKAFGHGLGHGVGLDVHEAPRLHWESQDELAVADVVTVEPGIYLDGVGGVRIEDCVEVHADGARVLTAAPKDDLVEV